VLDCPLWAGPPQQVGCAQLQAAVQLRLLALERLPEKGAEQVVQAIGLLVVFIANGLDKPVFSFEVFARTVTVVGLEKSIAQAGREIVQHANPQEKVSHRRLAPGEQFRGKIFK
jgi:hypothetical protein